ncbi:MAG: orotate phosphoribosyltransferase [Candidatus Eisenbacteria bacterium]
MRDEELVGLYERAGALLHGHFVLRSGLHSGRYLQSALLLARPELAARAGDALADLVRESRPAAVLSPALGGVIIGHETARALGVRFLFAEREGGDFALRRGFRLESREPLAVVEDVVTTGGAVLRMIRLAEEAGAEVRAVGALVDRSRGKALFPVPFHPVARLSIETFPPERCPLCREGIPIEKPGSGRVHA